MNQANKEIIAQALRDKGVKQPCPRCLGVDFEVVGQSLLSLNDNPRNIVIGGRALPTAIVACSKCGFITLHALGPLDLMPNFNEGSLT